MEELQMLDVEIVDQIVALSLLDLRDPESLSADEVYAAAELAVQMSTLDESLPERHHPPLARSRSRRAPPSPPTPNRSRRARACLPLVRTNSPPVEGQEQQQEQEQDQRLREERGAIGGEEAPGNILADSEASSDPEGEGDSEPCVACASTHGERRRLGCGCHYCAPCLRRCIRAGLRNEESWPPRCHERLAESDVRWVRRAPLLLLWGRLAQEWDSPAAERIYCARPACSAFIPSGLGGEDEARCGACGEVTCAKCRRPWHAGVPCEAEAEDEALMNMMDEYGFASCDNCRRIVEIREGCNHVTCGYQFCYLCGDRWRTCNCSTYGAETGRRPARARRRPYRQMQAGEEVPAVPPPPVDPQEVVFQHPPQGLWAPMPPMPEIARHWNVFGGPAQEFMPGNGRVLVDAPLIARDANPRQGERVGDLIFLPQEYSSDDDYDSYDDYDYDPDRSRRRRRRQERERRRRSADRRRSRERRARRQRRERREGRSPEAPRDPIAEAPLLPRAIPGPRGPIPEPEPLPWVLPLRDGRRMAGVELRDALMRIYTRSHVEEELERAFVLAHPEPPAGQRGRELWAAEMERSWRARAARGRFFDALGLLLVQDRALEGHRPWYLDPQRRYDIVMTSGNRPRIRTNTCNHHLPNQWGLAAEDTRPRCAHCHDGRRDRERRGAILECRGCGVQACQRHVERRFGLGLEEAEEELVGPERRRARGGDNDDEVGV
ncbi:uncharacterized protein DNG_04898 [Cephalotrichum gorgonifer]|uniref:RBR-type E3 ubiquitin transferase n=1 Tax=Cephalotrichum gorgonifer TaxID=2041049 RepID=A0AAE8MXH9_9PEZI|nr:uncharacterized protein DNG_04898 [Cephalotrichum gorgonifer]